MATQATESKDENGKKGDRVFRSKLGDGLSRFLAHVIENGLETGRRTPEDFIRHFPPATIMMALKDQPELRANILVITTGVRVKVALKKPAESCAIDLQIALDEEEADAETIVTLFDPDDRVRYLDHGALWTYVTEGDFWKADKAAEPQKHERAAKHVAYILDRALEDMLVTHSDVIDGITISKLAELLPRNELEKVLTAALQAGRAKKPFVDRDFLGAAPTSSLVSHVPLPWLWDQVVVPRIAQARKLADGPRGMSVPAVAAAIPAPVFATETPSDAHERPSAELSDGDDLDIGVDEVMDMLDDDKKKAPYVPGPPGSGRTK